MIAANPAMALTPKQVLILRYIQDHRAENGYCPSYDEIGRACGGISRATVSQHIAQLERRGALRRRPGMKRSIEVLDPTAPACQSCGRALRVLRALVDALVAEGEATGAGRGQWAHEPTNAALEAAEALLTAEGA